MVIVCVTLVDEYHCSIVHKHRATRHSELCDAACATCQFRFLYSIFVGLVVEGARLRNSRSCRQLTALKFKFTRMKWFGILEWTHYDLFCEALYESMCEEQETRYADNDTKKCFRQMEPSNYLNDYDISSVHEECNSMTCIIFLQKWLLWLTVIISDKAQYCIAYRVNRYHHLAHVALTSSSNTVITISSL